MTVYIGSAEFVARLQRENSELLAENLKLRKLIAIMARDWGDADMVYNDWLEPKYADEVMRIVKQLKGQEQQ